MMIEESTTENDLEVDAISRQALLNATVKKSSIWNKITNSDGDNLEAIVSKLPPVTPQEPRKDEVILTNKEYRELISNEYEHGYSKGYAEALEEQESVIDKIRAEIAEYGSIWVSYAIIGRKDSDIERLIKGVLKQAKEQVLDIIDKYKTENNL